MYNDSDNMFFSSCQTIILKKEINNNKCLKIKNTYKIKNDFEKAKEKLDAKLKKIVFIIDCFEIF